ncbi:MAG TPA: hypothetical protein VF487_02775 [Chitinophagaceae bacterium]
MSVFIIIPLTVASLIFPLMIGCLAKRFGRSFKFWFWVSFLLPFISLLILLCLPEKEEKIAGSNDKKVLPDREYESERINPSMLPS